MIFIRFQQIASMLMPKMHSSYLQKIKIQLMKTSVRKRTLFVRLWYKEDNLLEKH